MGKNKSNKNQIHEEIQRLLEKQRLVLFEGVRRRLQLVSPSGNKGNGLPERDLVLQFLEHEKRDFIQLEGAFNRIKEGRFGICESCQGEIHYRRLKARPITRLCMECQTHEENGKTLNNEEINNESFVSEPFLGRGCRPPST